MKENGKEVKLETFISNDWRNRIRVRTKEQAFLTSPDDSHVIKGANIHKLLSWIETLDDVPQAIQRARQTGILQEEDLDKVQKTMNELINRPELHSYYKCGLIVKNEPEILDAYGRVHRPDRVVFAPDGLATVIDYKTGDSEPEHEIQVKKYIELLEIMGFRPVKGIIIYLGDLIHTIEI
jgi:hypothetical protein